MDIKELKQKYDKCESFKDKLEAYQEGLDRIGVYSRGEALKPLVSGLAELKVNNDASDSEIETYKNIIADINKSPCSKENLDNMVSNEISEIRRSSSGSTGDQQLPLDDWLEANIDRVRVVRSTDSHVNTSYVWEFANRTSNIETEEEHYSYDRLSKEIYKQFSVTTLEPANTSNDDWGFWIEQFIERFKVEEEFTGTRTQVIEKLQSRLSDSDAYIDLKIAHKRGRVFYDEEEDIIHVPSDMISSICEEHGITPKSLQVELQAKGWIGSGGCSTKKRVGDKTTRFWKLPPTFAEVNRIDPDETEFESTRYVGDSG